VVIKAFSISGRPTGVLCELVADPQENTHTQALRVT